MSLKMHVTKRLGNFHMKIDLEIKEGIVGLLGYSGSGKSMTLKMIAGIETPDTGIIILNNRILFDAKQRINLKPQERNIGLMFQSYALFNHMSVYDNIGIGLKGTKDEKEKAIFQYSKLLHIEDLLKRKPGQLSGGQRQRVALARVLAIKPDILMLDEPFSALDNYFRRRIKTEFEEILKSYKGIVLYVSHNRNEIYHYCHKAAIVSDGQIIELKPTKDLYEKCETIVGAKLIGCRNVFSLGDTDEGALGSKAWYQWIKNNNSLKKYTHIGIKETDIILSRQKQNGQEIAVSLKKIEKMPEQVRIWLHMGQEDVLQYTCSIREYDRVKEWLEEPLYAMVPVDKILFLK